MANSIEAQGQTVDEAIQIALNQLGVSRDKVEIDILHHPRRGLLGIGARRAKVRATIRENVMLDGEEFDMSGSASLDDKPRRRRRRGGRSRGGRGDERPEAVPEVPARSATQAGNGREASRGDGERRGAVRRGGEGDSGRVRNEEGGRSREDRRGGNRGRNEQRPDRGGHDVRPESQTPRPVSTTQQSPDESGDAIRQGSKDRSGRGRQSSRDQHGERRDRGRSAGRSRSDGIGETTEPQPMSQNRSDLNEIGSVAESHDSRVFSPAVPRRQPAEEGRILDAVALEEVRGRAEGLVRELLGRMGFAAEVSSSVDEAAGEAVVSVRSESEGLLIGRRGQTLDSLEHLVNRMALRGDTYVEGCVLLDIGDYRKRRRESLDELAARLRGRAVGERRTVQVSPMSPRDRKFFALAFADDDTVEIRALGAGFYRRVVVAPAGMGAAAVAAAEAEGEHGAESVEEDTGFAGAEAEN